MNSLIKKETTNITNEATPGMEQNELIRLEVLKIATGILSEKKRYRQEYYDELWGLCKAFSEFVKCHDFMKYEEIEKSLNEQVPKVIYKEVDKNDK